MFQVAIVMALTRRGTLVTLELRHEGQRTYVQKGLICRAEERPMTQGKVRVTKEGAMLVRAVADAQVAGDGAVGVGHTDHTRREQASQVNAVERRCQ